MLAHRPGASLPLRRWGGLSTFYAALLAACLLPANAAASAESDESAQSDEAIRLDPVEVQADALVPPPEPTVEQSPTGFGRVIETREFAGQRIDVAELLLHAPGTRIHHAPGGATLQLRGGSSDQALVLLDGIPLNAAAGGGIDLRTVPAPLLERITVLRGNEGAHYGAGALGGVALLETRELRDVAGASLLFGAGSFDTYRLDGAAWGGAGAASGLAAISLHTSQGNYPALYDPTPEVNDADRRYVSLRNNDDRGIGTLLKGRLALGEDAAIHTLLHGYLGERGLPGTLYQPDDHRRDERRLLAALRLEAEPGAELRLAGGLELRHDEMAVFSDELVRDSNSQPIAFRTGKPWQIENALTARASAETTPVSWALLRAEFQAGGEWLDSPYHEVPARERIGIALANELYIGQRLTLAPALRWDRVGMEEGWSPRVGAAYRPIPLLEFRANWGRTFRAPSLGELYLEQARVKSNPHLLPEHGWSVDAGVVLRIPDATLQFTGFYSRIEDLILYELTSGFSMKPANFHDAQIQGGEVDAQMRPLSWLTLSGSYSLALTRNLRDDPRFWGKELTYRPAHRLQARLVARSGAYESFAEAGHQSAQFVTRANTKTLPASTSVGVGAGVRLITHPWSIWLSGQVDNAFDALLQDQLGFPQPGRAFTLTLRALSPEGRDADDRTTTM